MIETNLEVGRADVEPSAPAHVPGVKQGNSPRRSRQLAEGMARSTGINAREREPIDPRMPRLSPA